MAFCLHYLEFVDAPEWVSQTTNNRENSKNGGGNALGLRIDSTRT